ncbi:hypothetical protein D9M71_739050 [compost metagenome]
MLCMAQLFQKRAACNEAILEFECFAARLGNLHFFNGSSRFGREPREQLSAEIVRSVVPTLPLREEQA